MLFLVSCCTMFIGNFFSQAIINYCNTFFAYHWYFFKILIFLLLRFFLLCSRANISNIINIFFYLVIGDTTRGRSCSKLLTIFFLTFFIFVYFPSIPLHDLIQTVKTFLTIFIRYKETPLVGIHYDNWQTISLNSMTFVICKIFKVESYHTISKQI